MKNKEEIIKILQVVRWSSSDIEQQADRICDLFKFMVSDLVKVENAYIEDAEFVGSYDVTGRVEQLWITKEDFNKIKCISN